MYKRATFTGLLRLVAATLLALGCFDPVTSERRAHRAPAFALDAIAIAGQQLYVQSGFNVNLFAEGLDAGATTPVTLIPTLPGGDHITRTIAFGPDNLLYLAIGSSCNVCDDPLPRAAVTRYNLDGSNPHTLATGLRNSVGLAFHPTTGELWANNNDRDNLGDDLPPEHLNILRDGKWYGWPQCYLPGEANPEYPSADCSSVEPPALTFQAHSAPLGLAFYTGAMFPAEYQGDAFMTYHGSWNRTEPTGAKVVRVHVQNGQPTGIDDFVTGWQLPDGSRWGRPVSLLVMPDGALLVSDDWGGRIWRVSFGQTPPADGTGDLGVTTATTGSDPDPDGYTVIVAGTSNQPIATNNSTGITFTALAAGSHSVALSGVAANCSVTSADPQTMTVPSGGTVTAAFTVNCSATTGNLTVTSSTGGSSLDPDGYTVTVDGTTSQPIATNSSTGITFTGLAAGSHSVALSGVAANCTVTSANPQTVTVPSGGTVTAAFTVNCTTPPGNLMVTSSTGGSSLDPDGYTVTVDGTTSQPIATNNSTGITFSGLSAGGHSGGLSGGGADWTGTRANPPTGAGPSGGEGAPRGP